MSGLSVVGATAPYQVPNTAQAKADDERTESAAVRIQEANTGRDAAVRTVASNRLVDIKA